MIGHPQHTGAGKQGWRRLRQLLFMVAAISTGMLAPPPLAALPAHAQEYRREVWTSMRGPAASAVLNYAKDKSVECEQRGRPARCSLASLATRVSLFHFAGTPPTALAAIIYTPTSGSAFQQDVRIFEGDGQVHYAANRIVTGVLGAITGASFADDNLTVETATLRRNDAHCCPTGHAIWRVDRVTGNASFVLETDRDLFHFGVGGMKRPGV